ncbi:hypothetical protein BTR25_19280 [Bacillus sp. MRMR6]|nr:hypothetical protein BTR25_19280 [Bacillus sp. MRMR6]
MIKILHIIYFPLRINDNIAFYVFIGNPFTESNIYRSKGRSKGTVLLLPSVTEGSMRTVPLFYKPKNRFRLETAFELDPQNSYSIYIVFTA